MKLLEGLLKKKLPSTGKKGENVWKHILFCNKLTHCFYELVARDECSHGIRRDRVYIAAAASR